MPAPALPRLARTAPAPRPGVVHLGLGAFFRAHGALYLHEAMAASGGEWGVIGVSLRNPAQRDRLAPQDWAYAAVEQAPEGPKPRIVNALAGALWAPGAPEAVLAALAAPATRLVTLTVTEKGYAPDRPPPGVQSPPRSAAAYLVEALARRRAAGLRPFTALSCDNLSANGRALRAAVLDLAADRGAGLANWIAAEARFPACMVDRIVPALGPGDLETVARLLGCADAAPVLHEPYRQWVIEDDFVDGARPDLAAAGAELVKDVRPYETMKLRMLNGAHSALAYLGRLAGHATVGEAVADPALARFLDGLWRDELAPAVPPPRGADLAAYARALRGRFANPAIRHATAQIAADGSQKLPARLLAPARDLLEAGRPVPRIALAVAAWARCCVGRDDAGRALRLEDPLAETIRRRIDAAGPDPAAQAAALLALDAVFDPALAAHPTFRDAVTSAAAALAARGAQAAMAALG